MAWARCGVHVTSISTDFLTMFEEAKETNGKDNLDVDTQKFAQEVGTFCGHIETLDSLAEDLSVV